MKLDADGRKRGGRTGGELVNDSVRPSSGERNEPIVVSTSVSSSELTSVVKAGCTLSRGVSSEDPGTLAVEN